ncbi:MAG: hypothetical protein R3E79_46395 [Caldilineaceae bacterium]
MTQLAFTLFLLTFIFLFQDASHSVFAQTSDDWNPSSQKGDKQESAIAYPILTDEPHTHVHQKHQMSIQRTDPPMSIPDSATIVTGNVSGIWDTRACYALDEEVGSAFTREHGLLASRNQRRNLPIYSLRLPIGNSAKQCDDCSPCVSLH